MVCYNDAGPIEQQQALESLYTGQINLVREDSAIKNALATIWTDALDRTTLSPLLWKVMPQTSGDVTYNLTEKPTAFSNVGNRHYTRQYRVGHLIAGALLLEYMAGKNLYVRSWGIRSSYINEVQIGIAAIVNKDDGYAFPFDKDRIGQVLFDYFEQSHIPKMVLDENKTKPENIKGTVIQNVLACCRAFLSGFFSIFKRGK